MSLGVDVQFGSRASSDRVVHPHFKRSVDPRLLLNAKPLFGASHWQPRPRNPAKKAGIRYENKVLKHFTEECGNRFIPGLPFLFQSIKSQPGRAVPDGLLFAKDWSAVSIVEVKLRHSGDAFYQLYKFYLPILEEVFRPALRVVCLEVCQFYDPFVKGYKPCEFIEKPDDVFSLRTEVCHPVLILGKLNLRRANG